MPLHNEEEDRALHKLAEVLLPILRSPIRVGYHDFYSGSDPNTRIERHNLVLIFEPPDTEDGPEETFGHMEVDLEGAGESRRVELKRRVPKA